MCGSPSFDFHGALHVMGDVAAEIESDGEGPRVAGAVVNVTAKEVSLGVFTPADLRRAFAILDIVTSEIYGDVKRPTRSGSIERDGWKVVVYGPAGLLAVQ